MIPFSSIKKVVRVTPKLTFPYSFFSPQTPYAWTTCKSGSESSTNGNAYFEEAELVLVCRKMSRTPLRPEQFLDETVDGRWYPNKDYHEMYIAEVIDVLVKES